VQQLGRTLDDRHVGLALQDQAHLHAAPQATAAPAPPDEAPPEEALADGGRAR